MKNISRILIFTSLLSALLSFGCSDDLLIEYPKGVYHTGNYKDTTNVPYAILGDAYVQDTYAQFRGWTGVHFHFVGVTSITSDDADKGSSPNDGGVDMISLDNYTFNAANSAIATLYDGCYSAIGKSNAAIDFLRYMPDSLANERDQLVAEAKFLRAYNHFRLAQGFGGVSIIDKIVSPDDPVIARSSIEETWAFIESDLLFAIEYLPSKSEVIGTNYLGRATSEAARGFLAKVYLYQQKWNQAIEQTTLIIGSGIYDLSTPSIDIFKEVQENGKESLFEAQFASDEAQPGFAGGYAQIQGVRGSMNRGWGFNNPSEALVNAFEDGDPRKIATVIVSGQNAPDGVYVPSVDEGVANPYYNAKVWQWEDEINAEGRSQSPFGGWINPRLLRYADIVLMHAEAANEMGQSQEALNKLEMIRARARAGNSSILPEVTTTNQSELRAAIKHERRIELAMEHERYYDLIRWGDANEVLGPLGWTSKNVVFPIPQTAIDRSEGIIIQNPGY